MIPLVTERLILRGWRPEDRVPFVALNADPEAMRFLGGPISAADTEAMIDRFGAEIDREGFGIFAVEEVATSHFVGMIGLHRIRPTIPIAPAVEVAWRLAPHVWDRGYASEGARAALEFGFDDIGLPEIVAYTAASNGPSRSVMEKIGLVRAAERDFEHPALPAGDPLRRHVVYALTRAEWAGSA